jgi:hypothetical protein
MDDMRAFEAHLGRVLREAAGPPRPTDVATIVRAVTTTSPIRRFQSMPSPAKLVLGAAIVALFGGFLLPELSTWAPSQELSSVVGASAASPSPSPRTFPASSGTYLSGKRSLTVADVPLTFDLPVSSDRPWPWEALKDDLYISKNTVGPQGAEAMILWTGFPDSTPARPCLLDPSTSVSAEDLVEAVATAPGTKLVSGPEDVTVGGQAATHVEVTVDRDAFLEGVTGGARTRTMGCNPGYFFGWEADDGGAFWQETLPGDTIKVWIVDVDGTLLFIEAATHPEAAAGLDAEIDDIIDSIRFE